MSAIHNSTCFSPIVNGTMAITKQIPASYTESYIFFRPNTTVMVFHPPGELPPNMQVFFPSSTSSNSTSGLLELEYNPADISNKSISDTLCLVNPRFTVSHVFTMNTHLVAVFTPPGFDPKNLTIHYPFVSVPTVKGNFIKPLSTPPTKANGILEVNGTYFGPQSHRPHGFKHHNIITLASSSTSSSATSLVSTVNFKLKLRQDTNAQASLNGFAEGSRSSSILDYVIPIDHVTSVRPMVTTTTETITTTISTVTATGLPNKGENATESLSTPAVAFAYPPHANNGQLGIIFAGIAGVLATAVMGWFAFQMGVRKCTFGECVRKIDIRGIFVDNDDSAKEVDV